MAWSTSVQKCAFRFPAEGFSLGAAQEGIVAGDQFAFERAIAIHLAEDQGLRQVIVQVGRGRVLRDGLLEIGDGLVVFEVVEMIEAASTTEVCCGDKWARCRRQRERSNFSILRLSVS